MSYLKPLTYKSSPILGPETVLTFNTNDTMSVEELPLHYGDMQRDGTRVERPSEEHVNRQSLQDDRPLLRTVPQTIPAQQNPGLSELPSKAKDDARSEAGYSQSRIQARPWPLGDLEAGRSEPGRSASRHRYRDWRRHEYDSYSDYEDEDDRPYRPRRIRDRAYFPEDDYLPHRRPSRSSRYGPNAYPPRDRMRGSIDEYDDGPRTPRRYNYPTSKDMRYSKGPSTVQEGDEEAEGFARGSSPGRNNQIRFEDLSPEERRQIMRLPWTQWMDSNFKNRKHRILLSSSRVIDSH
jgi:aquaporin rerated protein, other eukaryote